MKNSENVIRFYDPIVTKKSSFMVSYKYCCCNYVACWRENEWQPCFIICRSLSVFSYGFSFQFEDSQHRSSRRDSFEMFLLIFFANISILFDRKICYRCHKVA